MARKTNTSLLIRGIEPALKARLRQRAAQRGRSMEQEAREILRAAVAESPKPQTGRSLAEEIRELFAPLGGVELEPYPRKTIRDPPKFD